MALLAKKDRTFELELIDATQPKSSTGMVDVRLFKGENKLHIRKNEETNFWSFYYEQGIAPQVLRCNFTSFKAALKFAEQYYQSRNLKIKELEV